jgi:methyl-accepting chemotaxis protein
LVDNTASSATEISATAEGLAAASQEQSAHADEVASAVEQMSRTYYRK